MRISDWSSDVCSSDLIPDNVVSWISNRNYGFSDATEVFVFISGYSVFLAYSGAMQKQGFVVGMARIWKRVWQIYTAHIFLFIIFVAQIAWLATRYNEALAEEMNIGQIGRANVELQSLMRISYAVFCLKTKTF